MSHTPQTLFEKVRDAHRKGPSAAVTAEVTLKNSGRKPKGFEDGYATPGTTVKVPKELPLTQGAFGALAFRAAAGLNQAMNVCAAFNGPTPKGVTATDITLYTLRRLPDLTEDYSGYVIELAGTYIDRLSIEERMTLCAQLNNADNVQAVIMRPTDAIFKAVGATDKDQAKWRPLHTDEDAEFDFKLDVDTNDLTPQATWAPNRYTGGGIETSLEGDLAKILAAESNDELASLEKGTPMVTLPIDLAFIGPFEDFQADALESAVDVFKGRKVASGLTVFIMPGSKELKKLAESKGWDKTFIHSGCVWNPSEKEAEELKKTCDIRCAETLPLVIEKPRYKCCHFMSAQMVATAAICGRIADVRDFI